MRRTYFWIKVCVVIFLFSAGLKAQQLNPRPTGREVSANRLITFNGTLKDASGQPRLGTVGVTFTLYASQEGGEGLWRESQTVQADEQGRYTVLLGITEKEGLPLEVFGTAKAQWLGIHVQGEQEQPRVLLVAVPYALKAADADTVGGRSLSSFVLYEDLMMESEKETSRIIAAEKGTASIAERQGPVQKTNQGILLGVPLLAKGGTVGPLYGNETGNNTWYGEDAGATISSGINNSFFGQRAGNKNSTGLENSFFGQSAGQFNDSGSKNSYFGRAAGMSNVSATGNSFFGTYAGIGTTTGDNSFFGYAAGQFNTTGNFNTIAGSFSGFSLTAGARNSFFGQHAGVSITTENNNSLFGQDSDGAGGVTNATAIGYRAKVTQSNSLVLGSINGVNGASADTKVGIGTTAPVSHLNVRSTTNVSPRGVTNEQYNDGMDGVQFRGRKARGTSTTPASVQSGDVLGNYVFDGHDGAAFGTGVQIRPVTEEAWTSTAHGAYLALWTTPPGTTTNTEKVRITGGGNVGIGTTNPTERLHVVGNLKVSDGGIYGTLYGPASPDTDVPDYVFDPDYKLMSLQELEGFVSKERHLPDIPKASEIREKGVNVNDFQMKLLEKIEELTLYTVQQERTIREQQARLAAIEQLVERIKQGGAQK